MKKEIETIWYLLIERRLNDLLYREGEIGREDHERAELEIIGRLTEEGGCAIIKGEGREKK